MRAVRNPVRQSQPDAMADAGVPPAPPEGSPKAALGSDHASKEGSACRTDPRQILTDRIIAMLEKGGHVLRDRWLRAAGRGMPRNGKTGKAYRGANVLILWDEAIAQGYSSNVWLTYKQAASLGAQVRRGERAVMCVHFERAFPKGDRRVEVDPDPTADGRTRHAPREGRLLCRPFWLFNVAQIAGLPGEMVAHCPLTETFSGGPVEAAVRLLGGCNPTIRHGFACAMYLPDLDEIRLPLPERFTSGEAYCATLLHELVHWTGHSSRLCRCFGQRFGDSAYAFEELVAELGAAFVLGHCGLVDATIEGHAAYLESWLRVLRGDRTAIFTAARHAGDAFEFILSRSMPRPGDLAAP